MTPLPVDEMRELVPGYVMGTLTADELRAFETTMREPTVASLIEPELAACRMAIEFLSTERSVTPPPALRDRMLSRISSERQRIADDDASAQEPASSPPVVPALTLSSAHATRALSPSDTRVVPLTPSRAPWWIAGMLGAALAASVAFAVNTNTTLRATQGDLAEAQRLAANRAGQLAESEATLKSLLDGGSDLVLVRLIANESPAPGMQVFWNKKKGTAVVLATGLKPVAAGRAYCLWMIKDGTPVAVKMFNVDTDGRAVVSGVPVPTSAEGIAAFAVTEEPAAGSPQPTMTPFLVGAVPK